MGVEIQATCRSAIAKSQMTPREVRALGPTKRVYVNDNLWVTTLVATMDQCPSV